MDRVTATFEDGVGAAAATSGIPSQLQERIFALLYLRVTPLALEAFTQGQPIDVASMQNVIPFAAPGARTKR